MYSISCPPGHSIVSKGIYDRQLDIALFKRLHATNFTLAPKRYVKILGPGSYNPVTIDEIYRQKSCSKYGPYYQQSKHLCNTQVKINGLYNIPDELRRKREFERRYNAIRLDRQSNDICRKRRELVPRAPPVTLYEKSRIYGPYVKLAQNRRTEFQDWYKGPARLQDKSPPSMLESLFSQSNRYKGKFLPIPSNVNKNNQIKSPPGPTTYFKDLISQKKSSSLNQEKNPLYGFLSSTKRFQKSKTSISHLGPASYKPNACYPLCSKKKQINTNF